MGFDAAEADTNGIVVASRPGQSRIHDWNVASCAGDEFLAEVSAPISFGSLSHSHLHQIMRNVKFGAKVEGLPAVAEPTTGRLSLEKLKMMDMPFGTAVETGLLWEILDWRIEEEEPSGCAIIQAAMNAKNGIALVRHEMQALAALTTMVSQFAVAERRLSLEAARAHLQLTLPEFASDEAFTHLFRFTVDMGGDAAGLISEVREFHARFVDPQCRRLRLGVFAVLNALPLEYPRLRIACLKYLYATGVPDSGSFLKTPSTKFVKDLVAPDMLDMTRKAESLLRFFHKDCMQAAALGHGEAVKWLGNTDKNIFSALVAVPGPAVAGSSSSSAVAGSVTALLETRDRQLRIAAGAAYKRLRQFSDGPHLPQLPVDVPEVAEPPTVTVKTLAPKVLTYVDGILASQQDEQAQERIYETLAWETFMDSDDVLRPMLKELIRSAVVTACMELTLSIGMPEVFDAIQIRRGGGLKGHSIVAKKTLKPGELVLAPLITSANRVVEVSSSGWAPTVEIHFKGQPHTVFLSGSFSLPSLDPIAIASPAVAASGALSKSAFPEVGSLSTHQWKPGHNPWPFWGVKRTDDRDKSNLEMAAVAVNQVVAFNGETVLAAPLVQTVDMSLPVLRNFKEIERGEELVAFWTNREPPQPKPKKGTKAKTWLDEIPKAPKVKKTRTA